MAVLQVTQRWKSLGQVFFFQKTLSFFTFVTSLGNNLLEWLLREMLSFDKLKIVFCQSQKSWQFLEWNFF